MTSIEDTGLRPGSVSIDGDAFDIPHPSPFLCELTVDGRHLSRAIEHVSNIEYVRWLDRAAELHSDSLGWTRAALLEQGVMWFVARHEIDYLAEAWRGEEIMVATWVRDLGRVKSWRDYAIIRSTDQKVICRAATLWVLVDLKSRRPKRISREMAERFEPLGWQHGGTSGQ